MPLALNEEQRMLRDTAHEFLQNNAPIDLMRQLRDGKDKKGLQVSSGMYYYGIKTPNFNKFKKLVLLK